MKFGDFFKFNQAQFHKVLKDTKNMTGAAIAAAVATHFEEHDPSQPVFFFSVFQKCARVEDTR